MVGGDKRNYIFSHLRSIINLNWEDFFYFLTSIAKGNDIIFDAAYYCFYKRQRSNN